MVMERKRNSVWIVSDLRGETPLGAAWDLVGIFRTHARALRACTKATHCIAPFPVDVAMPDQAVTIKQAYYPLAQDPPRDIKGHPIVVPRRTP